MSAEEGCRCRTALTLFLPVKLIVATCQRMETGAVVFA